MNRSELAHLELLAEIDALAEQLAAWADTAPDWLPARNCRAIVRRLLDRTQTLRIRLESPLVVATLGGTGTGKSALVNALLGAEVVRTGRQRPTTARPTLVCRPDLRPELLGIEPGSVDLVQRDLPALTDLVLIDCPDPDTTESPEEAATNLSRLRQILPHCDVLLVAATQQKYRSARVADELATAARGARLVFVQTHADRDQDIRDDWRSMLRHHYEPGRIFLVDSLGALQAADENRSPGGDFADLVDLLTRELSGSANAIRRANFLDLVRETLALCRSRLDAGIPALEQLENAILQQRAKLAGKLAQQTRAELIENRRLWENRLVGRIAAGWGISPFSLVLRTYQGLGGLATGALLMRARTPAQMALWGTMQGLRTWQHKRREQHAERSVDQAARACWDDGELRSAALILDGYAQEVGMQHRATDAQTVAEEADRAAIGFAETVGVQLESLVDRLAARRAKWFTRFAYELLLIAMFGVIIYRLGRNFFYDSWLAAVPTPVYGLDFYLSAAFWLLLWSALLLWAFVGRLRRGLRREINTLAENWDPAAMSNPLFEQLERQCRCGQQFRDELNRLDQLTAAAHDRLALPDDDLGRAV